MIIMFTYDILFGYLFQENPEMGKLKSIAKDYR